MTFPLIYLNMMVLSAMSDEVKTSKYNKNVFTK
jgi:hypothetical protein